MRVANVRVSKYLLGFMFRPEHGPKVAVTSTWPPDAEVIGGAWDPTRRQMVLMVTSAAFDDVPDGNVIPDFDPVFTARDVPASLLAMMREREEATRGA